MALDDYLPFDPDGTVSNTQSELGEIFEAIGADSWRDIFFDIEGPDRDTANERGARYATAEEAVFDMDDRGMLAFSFIVYYADEDLYGIYVSYDEG